MTTRPRLRQRLQLLIKFIGRRGIYQPRLSITSDVFAEYFHSIFVSSACWYPQLSQFRGDVIFHVYVTHQVQCVRQRPSKSLCQSFFAIRSIHKDILSRCVELHHCGRQLVVAARLLFLMEQYGANSNWMTTFFGPQEQVAVCRQCDVIFAKVECGIYSQHTKFGRIGAEAFNIQQLLVGGENYARI